MSRYYRQKGRKTADAGRKLSTYIPSERMWMVDTIDNYVFNLEREMATPYSRSKFILDMIELGLQTFAENPDNEKVIR